MRKLFVLSIPLLLFFNCKNDSSFQEGAQKNTDAPTASISDEMNSYAFPYRLNEPDATISLPSSLVEISGLSLSSDKHFLLINNDEQGKIFFLDKLSGTVVREISFAESADYEGIEQVGESIFLVQSNGTLFEVKKVGLEGQKTIVHKTHLKKGNNVEGLGYDSLSNQLLLACKGKAGEGGKFKRKRAVYAFDLKQKRLLDKPLLLINRDEIQKWKMAGENSFTEKLAAIFDSNLDDDAFAPSGIAVHPVSREIYALSSVGKIVVVLDFVGTILHIEPLDPGLHRQPEGICFDDDGVLFISNEGKGGKGKLMRFAYHPKR